ncbi:MAG: hypothetical protein J7L16_04760, partial [Deltaproteobacteria bacterium]|nr:hypothetical protein [Deltaproteobacteria bacterium]
MNFHYNGFRGDIPFDNFDYKFCGFASLNPHYKVMLTAPQGGLKSISDKITKAAKSVIIRNNFGSSVRRIKPKTCINYFQEENYAFNINELQKCCA